MIETFLFVRRHLPQDDVAKIVIAFMMPKSISAYPLYECGAFELVPLLATYEQFYGLYSTYKEHKLNDEADAVNAIYTSKYKGCAPKNLAEDYEKENIKYMKSSIDTGDLGGVKYLVSRGYVITDVEVQRARLALSELGWTNVYQPMIEFLESCVQQKE